jgi:polysaccharide pyruvyl transferase WcaK-like protein
MRRKIILLGATFATGNMGVHALTVGSITAALEESPSAEIYLLDYGKKREIYEVQLGLRTISVPLLNMRFSKKIYLSNNVAVLLALAVLLKIIPFGGLRAKFRRSNPFLRQIAEAETIGSIAGGDSFSDIYGVQRLLYCCLPQLLVLLSGRRMVLLPQTLGPFKGRLARILAKYILKRADLVYSRDRRGLEEMKALLGRDFDDMKFRFCYDLGFVVDSRRPGHMNLDGLKEGAQGRPFVVGLNVSGLLYMGGYTQHNMFQLKIDYKSLVDSLIRSLVEKYKASVLLVPHVFGPKSQNAESDQAVSEEIYKELSSKYENKLFLAPGNYCVNEIKYIIGLCDFFIGSRMHACIAALSQNIPTVSIAYSEKFKGVMETIGVDNYVADPRIMNQKEIFEVIDRAWEERIKIRQHLEKKMPEVKAAVFNLFKEIV